MEKQWKIYESMSDWYVMQKIFKNILADRLILLIKCLIKIFLLFMKLSQF